MDRRRLIALALMAALAACAKKQDEAPAPAPTNPGSANPGSANPGSANPGGTAPPPVATGVIDVTDQATATAALGKQVRLTGVTDNAMAGGLVVVGELVVFCTDRPNGWDERNKPIVVEGVLEREPERAPPTGANGEPAQGSRGGNFRIACASAH